MMATIKKIPAIRFKGFEEEWQEKKLYEIGETFTGLSGKTKVDFGHGKGRFVTYMNVFSNPISNLQQIEPIEIDHSQNSVKTGDVFFTISSETPEEVGMSSIWLGIDENVYLNSFCFGYRPISKLDNYYLAHMLRSSSFRKKITFLAQGISRYNISKNKVVDISISKPSFEEQVYIGNYFKELDDLIRLQEQKLEKVTNLKKVMLEKMFPKENTDVPEIRFKGFTDKWRKKKLGEVGDLLTGHPFESKKFAKNGIFLVRGMNVKRGYLDTSEDLSEYWCTSQGLENYLLKEKDIVIQMDGALIGKSYARISDKHLPALLVQRVTRIRNTIANSEFVYQKIQRDFLSHISKIKTETAVPHLSLNDIRDFQIDFPSIQEQQKIADYFQNLDQLISQSQQKIEQLKHLKQALLQKMFI